MEATIAEVLEMRGIVEENRELKKQLEQAREALKASAKEIHDLDLDVADERAKHKAAFVAELQSARRADILTNQPDYAHVKGVLEACSREEIHMREENRRLLPENRELKKQLEKARARIAALEREVLARLPVPPKETGGG